jgi:hypothetical protein
MPLEPRPLFVVGYMHSGTTLLASILGRHPDVWSSRGEPRFFELLPSLRERYRNLADATTLRRYVGYTAESLLQGTRVSRSESDPYPIDDALLSSLVEQSQGLDHAAIFGLVFATLMRRDGKTRWLERTPTHVFHIDEILAAFPRARIFEITRDARDVLASKKTRVETVATSQRYSEELRSKKKLEKAYDPLWDALSWKSAIAAGTAGHARHPTSVMRVSYERLVSAPEDVIVELCRFAELQPHPAMTEISLRTTADWDGRNKRSGIYKDSVGRWKRSLTPAEIALSQGLLARELRDLGYDIADVTMRERLEALALIPHSQYEFVDRLRRRWRMGGFGYVRRVLDGYRKRLGVIVRT